jgi:Ca2+-binding RTX toxin-like protein
MWRVALAVAALAALALVVQPTAASPKGKITIRGASSGSHLKVTYNDGIIFVDGYLAGQKGCRSARGGAVCPASGVSSIEFDMGSAADKVEVHDPLPIPLTVHLGAGSDKFIGNDEPDTCFSEGARRNRCIGGGGDDRCFTGEQNSDCVGGPGDDICKHGAGSDGCWGGPGDDYCYMGSGKDGCHGGPGDDHLYGGPDPDQLYGGPGRDFCDGGPGLGKSHGCEKGPGH